MLAPLIESLFVVIFAGIRDVARPVRPVTLAGSRAAYAANPEFWDPHFVFNATGKKHRDMLLGIMQLVETTGLTTHMPADYFEMLGDLRLSQQDAPSRLGMAPRPSAPSSRRRSSGKDGRPTGSID